MLSAPLSALGLPLALAFDAQSCLGSYFESGKTDELLALQAFAIVASFAATQGGFDLLQSHLGGLTVGLCHVLLLHGVHARKPAYGFVQVHRFGCVLV